MSRENSSSAANMVAVCAAAVLGGGAVLAAQRLLAPSPSSLPRAVAVPAASVAARAGATPPDTAVPGTPAAAGHFQRMIKIEQERDHALASVRRMKPKIAKLQAEGSKLRRRKKGLVVSLPDPSASRAGAGGACGEGGIGVSSVGSMGSIGTTATESGGDGINELNT